MNRLSKFFIIIMFVGMTAFVFAESVDARGVSVWVGTWQSFDIPGDGSTNTLEITHGASRSTYDLVWTETYFSLCKGAPGIGYGTAYESFSNLYVSMTFYCKGSPEAQHYELIFTYNTRLDNFTDGTIDWARISPRPW